LNLKRLAGVGTSKPSPLIFISYSHEDEVIANATCIALESGGIPCWMAPRDVRGGRPYSGQITQAIREARVLLLIFSQATNRSKHVLREVERAAHCQTELLTFRIEPATPSDDLAYFLGADHWVDGFRPLPPSEHFSALIEHAQGLLQEDAAESDPADQSEASSVDKFAHFRIDHRTDGSLFKLGKGGMGVTYKAVDTILNRSVALKVIAAEQLNSPQAKHRFLREAQAAALIHHPHVATIFQFGQEGDAYFYAMEFVEGEDLERYVARQGPLSPAAALRVTLQIAQALEAAQARHLIHRDIKPANIMAVANRAGALDVKLIDFGLAKGAGADSLDPSNVTRTLDFVGSPAFASPEQCETKKLDIRSDIYSLGVTVWYLLSGKRPFAGTVGEVMVAQIIKPPPFDQLAGVPEVVIALLRRMLEKRPEDRFQTPEELQAAVEEAIAQSSNQFALPAGQRSIPANLDEGRSSSGDPPPVNLAAIDSPLFGSYLKPEVGMLLGNRYRLLAEEREGNGGRLFLACDEQDRSEKPSKLALKLLHPEIVAEPSLMDLLENEVGIVQRAPHPGLVGYLNLERSDAVSFLVREWVPGFLLYDLLRWRRSLKAHELAPLLEPLAATLDFVSGHGLGLVDVSVHKVLLACPREIEDFEALAKGPARAWSLCSLKLNPLSLAPLLFRNRNGWDRRTIVPASNVLSMTQAGAGIQGTKAVRLYGRLLYEVLSGRPPDRKDAPAKPYKALPELDQTGNEILRRALIPDSHETYQSCTEFWGALKPALAGAGPGTRSAPSTAVGSRPEKAAPAVSSSSGMLRETGVSTRKNEGQPPIIPSSEFPTQTPVISGTQRGRNAQNQGRRPMLILLLAAIAFGLLGIIGAIALAAYIFLKPSKTVEGANHATQPTATSSLASVTPSATATITPAIVGPSVSPSPNVAAETPIPLPASPSPDPTEPNAFVVRLLAAMQVHDYETFLTYVPDKLANYFDHKNATRSFIQKDMEQDEQTYMRCRFDPDVSTFRTSLEQDLRHDSIEYDSEAKEMTGKRHKARCRLDIYYAPGPIPKLQSITLKVLP
jgi:serine/threonine protein kinase